MSLTVPFAGTSAGRAAQPEAPQASPLGGMMADFGNQMLAVGTALENDRLDREMSRLKVDMTRDLGNLRLQVEDMGDPDAAGAAWDQGMARLRDSYLNAQGDNGRPRVDPKNRDNFGLAFDDLSNSHALSLGGRFLALRQSQRAATYYEYTNVAGAEAARSDPSTRDQLYADFDAETDKQVAAGTMTPEQAAVAKRGFRQSTENTAAISAAAEDPTGMIEALDAGEYAALDPETRARYRVSAQAELDRRAAAATRDAEAQARERSAQIDKRLGEIIDIAGNDRVAVDEAWIESPEVKGSARYNEAQAAIALRNERADLSSMTVPELDAMIADEAKKPVGAKFQTERLKVLEATRAAAAEGWRKDQIAFARKAGLPVPNLPEFDAANPAPYADAIAARVTFGQGLKERGYTSDTVYLDQEEQAGIRKTFASTTDPAARATLAGTLTAAVLERGGDPNQIQALADDPVLGWAGGMLATGAGSQALAAEILSGEAAMAAKNLTLPPVKDRMEPAFAHIGTLFADMPGGEERQAQFTAAADALYAARVRRTDPNGAIDEDLYKQAMHEVMGGTGTVGGKTARGGIQDVSGRSTIVDPGISAADFDGTFDAMRTQIGFEQAGLEMTAGVKAMHKWPASAATALTAASRSRGLPTVGGQVLSVDDLNGASFIWVGRDAYKLVLGIGGGVEAVDSTSGQPFVFSLTRLMREYGQ